jgi:hypothetical protein
MPGGRLRINVRFSPVARPAVAYFRRLGRRLGASCEHVSEPVSFPANRATEHPPELVERKIRVASEVVVLIKGICEASEGLCAMFAEQGGELVLAAPHSRERELDELIHDLRNDFGATLAD